MGSGKSWTKEEIDTLKELWPMAPLEEIRAKIPNRSNFSLRLKAHSLKISREIAHKPLLKRPHYKLTELEKVWLAAAFDFEGSIGLRRNGSQVGMTPWMEISNTNETVVRRMCFLLGFTFNSDIDKRPDRKRRYRAITATHAMVYYSLKEIFPYLIIKKKQAELVSEWIEIRNSLPYGIKRQFTPRQQAIYDAVRTLNKRGTG